MATDPIAQWKAKVTKLASDLRTVQAKTYEILEELHAVLGEGPEGGNHAKDLLSVFGRLWAERYGGEKYVFTWAKDGAQAKRLLRALPLDELEARIRRYLASTDPFVASRRHPWAIFCATVNSYAAAPARVERILGCIHELPCLSEAACTKLRMRAVRGSHSGPVGDVI
jgi:hypothetical protein